jgi:hypothetical protein
MMRADVHVVASSGVSCRSARIEGSQTYQLPLNALARVLHCTAMLAD